MKPIFCSKIKSGNSITLVGGTKIIQEERELATTINKFFVSIVKNLGINENLFPTSSSETRNVESIIAKFENHPSIMTICNRIDKNNIFSFKKIGKIEVIKEIQNLDIKKRLLSSDILTKIIKEFGDLFAIFTTKIFRMKENFQKSLKLLKLLQFI